MNHYFNKIKENLKQKTKDELIDFLILMAKCNLKNRGEIENMAFKKNSEENIITMINRLKRSKYFYSRSEAHYMTDDIRHIMFEIENNIKEPEIVIKLIMKFLNSDNIFAYKADDSYGDIGNVFYDLCYMFAEHAKNYKDRKKLLKIVEKSIIENDYGLKDGMMCYTDKYLSNKEMLTLYEKFMKITCAKKSGNVRSWFYVCEELAKSMQNPELLKDTYKKQYNEDIPERCIFDLAKLYFNISQFDKSLKYLKKISEDEFIREYKMTELLIKTYLALNMRKEAEIFTEKIFLKKMTSDNYKRLINIIDKEKSQKIIDKALEKIKNNSELSNEHIYLLLSIEKFDIASEMIIKFKDEINGNHYSPLLEWLKIFEGEGYYLVSSVLYRALLESILAHAISKYYKYGIRYLKKMDKLNVKIDNWKNVQSHDEYKAEIIETHKRKKSFWGKYND